MADAYVKLPFVIDQQQIIDDAITRLQARWGAGWMPNDGDAEVVILEQGGAYAAALAYVASQMPPMAFAAFGMKLYNIPPLLGTPALTTVTLDITDASGWPTIPAGVQFNMDSYAFVTTEDVPVPPGTTVIAGVHVASVVFTAAASNLTGDVIAQLSLPPYVSGLTVEAPTTSGTDPETPLQYLSRLSRELELRAKTIVTTRDFVNAALDFSTEIGRAQAIGDTARLVTITLATPLGEVVSTPTKTALAAYYTTYSQVNTTYTILDATYTTVAVAYTATVLPGRDPTLVKATIDAFLANQLSPAVFGQAASGDPGASSTADGWLTDPKVYHNDVIAWIKSIPGVKHVPTVTLSAAGLVVDGNGDLTLPGTTPLTRPGVMTGTVS